MAKVYLLMAFGYSNSFGTPIQVYTEELKTVAEEVVENYNNQQTCGCCYHELWTFDLITENKNVNSDS